MWWNRLWHRDEAEVQLDKELRCHLDRLVSDEPASKWRRLPPLSPPLSCHICHSHSCTSRC